MVPFTVELVGGGEVELVKWVYGEGTRLDQRHLGKTAQGPDHLSRAADVTDGPSTFRLAITGGTGRYRTAHGVAIVQEVSETRDRITFRIIR